MIPEIPSIHKAKGKDKKERYYIIANNPFDIDFILHASGLGIGKITEQNDSNLIGFYRILRKYEYDKVCKVFPPYEWSELDE